MGKGGNKGQSSKDGAPNTEMVQNRDILQRLNFLYQASFYLTELSASTSSQPFDQRVSSYATNRRRTRTNSSPNDVEKNDVGRQNVPSTSKIGEAEGSDQNDGQGKQRSKRKAEKDVKSSAHLSRSYLKSMRIIGQKTMVRLDPAVKRTICRGCNSLILPGVTANVRSKAHSKHAHNVSYICKTCSSSRRFLVPSSTGLEGEDLDLQQPADPQTQLP